MVTKSFEIEKAHAIVDPPCTGVQRPKAHCVPSFCTSFNTYFESTNHFTRNRLPPPLGCAQIRVRTLPYNKTNGERNFSPPLN